MRFCGALNNSFPNSTAGFFLREQKERQAGQMKPLLQEQRQKGAHSLQVKEGTEWLCTSSLCKTESNAAFLSSPGRSSRKQVPQWAMREPPENHNRLSCLPLNPEQAGTQTLHSDTSMIMNQKDQTLKLQSVRGLLRETMPRAIPYNKHQAKYRTLSNA